MLLVDDSVELAERFVDENEGYLVDLHDFSLGGSPTCAKAFPETWIWLDTNMGYGLKFCLNIFCLVLVLSKFCPLSNVSV